MRSRRAAALWLVVVVPIATVAAACADVEEEDIGDRRYPAWIFGVDVERRTVTIDEIEWLSGEEAARAWRRNNPAEPADDGPPNDYYIVDTDDRARTLFVAPDVDVALVRLGEDSDGDLDPGTFEELPAYFRSWPASESGSTGRSETGLWSNPFWLTVRSGTVVGIEEQYRP